MKTELYKFIKVINDAFEEAKLTHKERKSIALNLYYSLKDKKENEKN